MSRKKAVLAAEKPQQDSPAQAAPTDGSTPLNDAAQLAAQLEALRRRPMTPQETAVYLRISSSTLKRYVRAGIVPAVKMGKHVRFFEEDVRKRLQELAKKRSD